MKRDVLNVWKCTAGESRQQVVVVLPGCCEEGKGSNCFSGGPIKDVVGSCWHRALEMGDWGSRHPSWLGTSWEGWQGAWGCLLLHVHGVERATNPAVHAGARTRTSKMQMLAGENRGTAATQEPEQLTKNFSCCSLGPFKWLAKVSPRYKMGGRNCVSALALSGLSSWTVSGMMIVLNSWNTSNTK